MSDNLYRHAWISKGRKVKETWVGDYHELTKSFEQPGPAPWTVVYDLNGFDPDTGRGRYFYEPGEWHETREQAQAAWEKRRAAKEQDQYESGAYV